MSSIQEIEDERDLYKLREENPFLAILFYSDGDEKKYSEVFDEFEAQSKSLPEIKFFKANQKKISSIKRERFHQLGVRTKIKKKQNIYLFNSGNLMASYYYSVPLLKANLPRLLGKPAPALDNRVTTLSELENTLKKNKCVVASFKYDNEAMVEKFLIENSYKDVQFVTIDNSVFKEFDKYISNEQIEEENNEDFTKFNIYDGAFHVFSGMELKSSEEIFNERKVVKAVNPVIGKEVPALPEGFIEDLDTFEKSIKAEKLSALFVLRTEKDSIKFDSIKKHFPEVKIFFTVYYDSKNIVNKYASIERTNRFGEKESELIEDYSLPALVLFKNGEKIYLFSGVETEQVDESLNEYMAVELLSLLAQKPLPKVAGWAVSLEDFESFIKENKYVYCYGYNETIYKRMEENAKKFPEVKVIKVELSFLESINKKYFNEEKDTDVHAFFRNGTLIEQVHRTAEGKRDKRITDRTFEKCICNLLEKKAPKTTDGSVDDYDEYKSIIEKNKVVLVSFQSVDDEDWQPRKVAYKTLIRNPENKDVKFIYLLHQNIVDFVGKPLVPKELFKFYIYLDGILVYEQDKNSDNVMSVKLQRQINKILRKNNDPNEILNLDEYEKFVKNNEFVLTIFHDFKDEKEKFLVEYHKIKTEEKYKKIRFVEFNKKESGVEKIFSKLGASGGYRCASLVVMRNGVQCQDYFMNTSIDDVLFWANYFCGYERTDFILEQTKYEQELKQNEKMIIYLGDNSGKDDKEGEYAIKKLKEQVPDVKVFKMYWYLIKTSEKNLKDYDEYDKNFGFNLYKKGAKVKFFKYPVYDKNDEEAYKKDTDKIIPEIKKVFES